MNIADLHLSDTARTHSTRNQTMLDLSIAELGLTRSIVIDEHNTVLAGNGVVAAARRAGVTQVDVLESQRNHLVAVRVSGFSAEQKQRLMLWDNRCGELSYFDVARLADVIESASGMFTPWETGQIKKRSPKIFASNPLIQCDPVLKDDYVAPIKKSPRKQKLDIERYKNASIKQIVLYVSNAEYTDVLHQLEAYMAKHAISDHSSALLDVLEKATDEI